MSIKKTEKINRADKIGILTFHCADNFGAMLQAFGLLSWLRKRSFDASIINYIPFVLRGREWLFPYMGSKGLRAWTTDPLRIFYKNVRTGKDWWARKRQMKHFREKYLTEGAKPIYWTMGLSRIHTDILIVGSDQIWNPDFAFGFIPAYFGAFQNRYIKKTIAYAASFGSVSLPRKAEPKFCKLLDSVQNISVREKSAAEYIRTQLGRKVEYAFDPVFLLSANEWRMMQDCPKEHNFIFFYETEYNEELRIAACQLAEKRGLSIIELASSKREQQWPFQVIYSAGPSQFLGYLSKADYVFTNSFHGIAFSILFHRPFYACTHKRRGARLESLLQSIGLTSRMAQEGYVPNFEEEINWEQVEKQLQQERRHSEAFLYRSLTT